MFQNKFKHGKIVPVMSSLITLNNKRDQFMHGKNLELTVTLKCLNSQEIKTELFQHLAL